MTPLNPARENRCTATSRNGERCKHTAMTGLKVCRMHGGKTPRAARKSELAKAKLQVIQHRGFAEPVAADDWEANPINSFEMEFRRTLGWIRYYEQKIAEGDEEALVWGRTKVQDTFNEEGYAGKAQTDEAKPSVFLELLFRERRHLHDLQKTWIGAGLASKKLDLERDMIDKLEVAIVNTIVHLGLDAHDASVRKAIRDQMMAIAALAS